RNQVRGIVHDQSASGATLFVEPLAVLDLTNRWRELQIEEQREVERVLAELSGLVGADHYGLEASVEVLAELDLHFAMARLAEEQQATKPELRGPRPTPPAPLPLWEGRGPGAAEPAPLSPLTEPGGPAQLAPAPSPPFLGREGGPGGVRPPVLRFVDARHPLLTGE